MLCALPSQLTIRVPRNRTSPFAARAWLSSAARGNPWLSQRARAAIPIGPLISPLRYDILVRASYFHHFAAKRQSFDEDFDAYARSTRSHAYFTWFRDVMCVRWQPHVLADESAFEAAWRRRLRAAAALHDSFTHRGFDLRYPVTLHAGVRVLPTATGKRVSHSVFAGDGNHRIALLLAAGQTELGPTQFRIQRFLRFEPPDTTSVLVPALGVSPAEYTRFLGLGYPTVRVAEARARLEVLGPETDEAAEVRRIIELDLRLLAKAS